MQGQNQEERGQVGDGLKEHSYQEGHDDSGGATLGILRLLHW